MKGLSIFSTLVKVCPSRIALETTVRAAGFYKESSSKVRHSSLVRSSIRARASTNLFQKDLQFAFSPLNTERVIVLSFLFSRLVTAVVSVLVSVGATVGVVGKLLIRRIDSRLRIVPSDSLTSWSLAVPG